MDLSPRAASDTAASHSAEEQARADFYALIGALLLRAPDQALLTALASADSLHAEQTDHPLDQAWEQLILAASLTNAGAVKEEFNSLFIRASKPQVNPYASLYLSGFMMEKPLAALRDDLRTLGLSRTGFAAESEDHLGALCEVMRLLIGGTQAAYSQPLSTQKAFFTRHIAPWYDRCLDDIERAEGASFYRQAAGFARAFLQVESEAFDMEDGISSSSK